MDYIIYTRLTELELRTLIKSIIQESIEEISSSKLPKTDKLLNLSEVAKLLGLSKASVYRLVSHRQIPFHKSGGRLYFFEEELRDWIKNSKK